MSGALTERVFVQKLDRVGFDDIRILDRLPFSLERAADYPLFTPDLVELMRRLIPPDTQDEVATSLIVTAGAPA